jgi:predicted amidohydrolase
MANTSTANIVKVACIQITAEREFEPNIKKTMRMITRAKDEGAALVTLPENTTMLEPIAAAALRKAKTEEEHPGFAAYRKAASNNQIWLLVGSLSIKLPSGKLANRSYLIGPDGNVAAQYDKVHLFDVNLREDEWYRESDTIEPGDQAVLAESPWGLIGMTVCYDLRFPQLYRDLAQRGARILTIPAAFTKITGEAHWEILVRARAIETGCFVIAPAQWGEHAEGRKTFGHSLIVDPWGTVLADGGDGEGYAFAEIDLSQVDKARARVRSLTHDRVYSLPAGSDEKAAAE